MIERHNKILELIKKHTIDTQEDLANHLAQSGYQVTQATVSRDIKKLRLVKRVDSDGRSRYVTNDSLADDTISKASFNIFSSSVIDVNYAENLVVVKTLPGMAQAIGAAVDGLKIMDILGCIAGDDTLLVVAKDKLVAEQTVQRFHDMR